MLSSNVWVGSYVSWYLIIWMDILKTISYKRFFLQGTLKISVFWTSLMVESSDPHGKSLNQWVSDRTCNCLFIVNASGHLYYERSLGNPWWLKTQRLLPIQMDICELCTQPCHSTNLLKMSWLKNLNEVTLSTIRYLGNPLSWVIAKSWEVIVKKTQN